MIKKNFSLLLLVITIFPLCSGSLDVGLNGESGSFGEIGLDLNLNPLDIDFGGNYSINVNSTEWWNTAIGPLDNADATQHNNVGGVLTISETYLRSFGDGEWLQLDGGNSPSAHINWGGFNLFNVNNLTVDGYINGIGDKITNVVHLLYNETIDGRKTFTDTIICENNMIINGDFATDSDWTLGGTATISGGKGNFGSNTATFTQDIGVEVGKKYIVTFTLSSLAGGPVPAPYVQFTLGGVTGSVRGSDNTYTQEITATNTNPLVFQAGGVLTGASIDDVSVIGYGIEVEGRAEINYLDVKKELLVEGTDNSGKLTVLDSDNKNMFNVNTAGRTIKMGDTDYITFSESGRGALNLESGGFAAFTGTRVGYPNTGLGYLNEKMMFSADVTLENYIGLWTPENAGYHVFEWGSFNNGNPTAPLLFINAGSGSAFSASIGYTLEKDQFTLYPDGSYHQYGAPRIYYDGLHEVESYYLAGISNTHEFGYKVTAGTNTGITSAFEVGDGTITNALDCNDKNIVDVKDININGDTVLGIDSSDTITFNAKSASDLDMGGYDLENIGNINATKNITSTNILPQITDTYSIGSSLLKWLNGYFINLFVTNATIENLNVTGNLVIDGNLSFKNPYGIFSSNESQIVTVAENVYVMNFSHIEDNYLIGLESNENITIPVDGDYEITLSVVIVTDTNNKHFEVFPQTTHADGITFANVPRSNTRLKIENAGTEDIIAVSFILDLKAGEKFRIMYSSDDAGSMTVWTDSHGTGVNTVPETPSIIMTIKKISEITA